MCRSYQARFLIWPLGDESPPDTTRIGRAIAICAALAATGLSVGGPIGAEPTPAVPTATAKNSQDDAPALGTDWVRVEKDSRGEVIGMQTAIIRYVPRHSSGPPVYVDLVGAVHVGDKRYYDALNKRFEQYDVLLYELVAPDGTVVRRGEGSSNLHVIGALQNGMKNMLELEHQLEQVDYTKPNFVHADMSPEDFARSTQDLEGGFVQLYFKLLGQGIAQQSRMAAKGESMDVDIIAVLFSQNRARALKVAMAKQMAEVETLLAGFGGDAGSTLISERNKVAVAVLRKQLDAGKRRIGVFYGAGHLADMDQRLRKEFEMEPTEIVWLTAWDLTE